MRAEGPPFENGTRLRRGHTQRGEEEEGTITQMSRGEMVRISLVTTTYDGGRHTATTTTATTTTATAATASIASTASSATMESQKLPPRQESESPRWKHSKRRHAQTHTSQRDCSPASSWRRSRRMLSPSLPLSPSLSSLSFSLLSLLSLALSPLSPSLLLSLLSLFLSPSLSFSLSPSLSPSFSPSLSLSLSLSWHL